MSGLMVPHFFGSKCIIYHKLIDPIGTPVAKLPTEAHRRNEDGSMFV